jgi:hypothetical protein
MQTVGPLAACCLALVLTARPAAALGDLTGTWEGTMACTTSTPSGIYRGKEEITISLYDDLLGTLFGFFNGSFPLSVGLIPFMSPPSKGVITAYSCAFDPASSGGYTLQLSVTAKEGSEKGTLKGTFISQAVGPDAGAVLCKVRAKRVDTAIPSPMPGACPP